MTTHVVRFYFAHLDWAKRGVFYASDFDSRRFPGIVGFVRKVMKARISKVDSPTNFKKSLFYSERCSLQ